MSIEGETRNKWPHGIVRHLRLDPWAPADEAFAIRADFNGGMFTPGGSTDIHYTLVIHPKHTERADEYRHRFEADPRLGGLFSPPRDVD